MRPRICNSLEMMFSQALNIGLFPSEWKIGNVATIHKKNDKKILINYYLVSLLLFCGKILKIRIFNKMLRFFLENKLITPLLSILNLIIPVSTVTNY